MTAASRTESHLPMTRHLACATDVDEPSFMAQVKYNTETSQQVHVGPWILLCSLLVSISILFRNHPATWEVVIGVLLASWGIFLYFMDPRNGLVYTRTIRIDPENGRPTLETSDISLSTTPKTIKVFRPWIGFKKHETLVGVTGDYYVSLDGFRYEEAFLRI